VGNDVKPASTIYTDFVKSHGTVRVGGESSHRLRQHASTGAATEGDKEADAHVAHGRFQQPAASLTGDHGTIVGKEVAEREKQQQQHYTPSLTSSASSMGASVKRQQPTTSAVGGVVVVKGAEVGPSRTRPRIPPVSTNDAEGKVKAEKEHEQGDDDLQQMAIQYAGSLRRNHSGPAAAAAKKGHTYTDPIDVEAPSPHGEGRGVERTRSPVARNRIHAEGKKKQKQKIERKRRREHVDDATEEDTSISGPTRRPSSSSHHHNHHQQKRKRSDGKKKIDDPTNRTQKKKRRRRDEQKSAEIVSLTLNVNNRFHGFIYRRILVQSAEQISTPSSGKDGRPQTTKEETEER
jgi:hypothetical protein